MTYAVKNVRSCSILRVCPSRSTSSTVTCARRSSSPCWSPRRPTRASDRFRSPRNSGRSSVSLESRRARLGRLRRVIEADDTFRARIAVGAVPELVDPIGILWLQRPAGLGGSGPRLLAVRAAEERDADLRTALKRAEKRRVPPNRWRSVRRPRSSSSRRRLDSLRNHLTRLAATSRGRGGPRRVAHRTRRRAQRGSTRPRPRGGASGETRGRAYHLS